MNIFKSLNALTVIVAVTVFAACGPDKPGVPSDLPVSDTTTKAVPSAAIDPADTASAPVTGVVVSSTDPRSRPELVAHVKSFVGAIAAGNEQKFREMLSARSRQDIAEFSSQREIWSVANEALGGIDDLNVQVVGGRGDSVALLIHGQRITPNDTVDEELIINLLREDEQWKVMYPGLLHPKNHLRK